MKGSGEDEIGTFFLKSDIYDPFYPVLACDHSQIVNCTLAMLYKFSLHLIFLQNTPRFLRYEWITEEWF